MAAKYYKNAHHAQSQNCTSVDERVYVIYGIMNKGASDKSPLLEKPSVVLMKGFNKHLLKWVQLHIKHT